MTHENETAELLAMVESSVTAFLAAARSSAADGADVWREIVELGLPLVGLAEAQGGSGLGAAGFTCVARQFGMALTAEPFVACGVAPAAVIGELGDSPLARAALLVLNDGAGRVAFAAKPSGAAAVLDQGRLTGQWKLVPHPATHLLIAADDALCLVDLEAAGITTEVHQALDGSQVATVAMTGMEPLQTEQGPQATRAAAVARAASKLAHAAQLGGMAESAFRLTQDYVKTRTQFGQSIGSFQAIQHRSVDQLMANSLTVASVESAAAAFDLDPGAAATAARIAAALARAATSAAHIARESVQMHGGIGFTAEAEIGRYTRALTGTANLYGTARENRRLFAQLEEAV